MLLDGEEQEDGDVKRILEALAAGCGMDDLGSFAVWLSRKVEGK